MIQHLSLLAASSALFLVPGCAVRSPDPVLGVVSSASPEATAAGVRVLEAGGNAVDAAVAVAFALGVTEPAGSGLAGQAFFLIHPPDSPPVAIRGTTLAPAAIPSDVRREDLTGRRACTVPSLVAVMDLAWRRFGSGRLQWDALLEPAARAAEEGFPLGTFRQASTARYARALRSDPEAAEAFLDEDGGPPSVGDIVRQPDLARTLRLLATTGADGFYRGEIARRIHADMQRNGGWMTYDDLAGFPSPEVVPAVRGSYRGWDVYTLPPPAGGWVVLLGLNLLEQISTEQVASTPDGLVWMAETLRAAHGARVEDPVRDLDDYTQAVRQRVQKSRAIEMASELDPPGSGETTHLSVADSNGLVVSATLSLNAYFGARVMCPDLGFLYNDYMREFETGDPDHPFTLAPGAMPYSSMSATILSRDGQAHLALGSPGSRRIISAVIQVIRNWVDRKTDIASAVAEPRMHVVPEDDDLLFEVRPTSRSLIRDLELRGMTVSVPVSSLTPGPMNAYFGGVHAVSWTENGWRGAADPRRDGAVGIAHARSTAMR